MDSFRSISPLDSPFSEPTTRSRIIKVIRRPRDYSLDDNTSPLTSRSYSVIRRVRRLQTTTPNAFANEFTGSHDDFVSPSTIMRYRRPAEKRVVVVRKRKIVPHEGNEDPDLEQSSRITYVRRVNTNSLSNKSNFDDINGRYDDLAEQNFMRKNPNTLGNIFGKCTKLCLISSIVASLLTAAIVSAIIIPIMIKWKESSTQTSEMITTTISSCFDITDIASTSDSTSGSGWSTTPIISFVEEEENDGLTTIGESILQNDLPNWYRNSDDNLLHQTIILSSTLATTQYDSDAAYRSLSLSKKANQITLEFISATNNILSSVSRDSKNCTGACYIKGNWSVPLGAKMIEYRMSFVAP